jgi:hypothetical protein
MPKIHFPFQFPFLGVFSTFDPDAELTGLLFKVVLPIVLGSIVVRFLLAFFYWQDRVKRVYSPTALSLMGGPLLYVVLVYVWRMYWVQTNPLVLLLAQIVLFAPTIFSAFILLSIYIFGSRAVERPLIPTPIVTLAVLCSICMQYYYVVTVFVK